MRIEPSPLRAATFVALRHRHDQLRRRRSVEPQTAERLRLRPLHLDRDPVAVLLDLHDQPVDGLARRPALFDLDEHIGAIPGPHLNRTVEGREAKIWRTLHGKALLFTLDQGLRVDVDHAGGRGNRRSQKTPGEGNSHTRIDGRRRPAVPGKTAHLRPHTRSPAI